MISLNESSQPEDKMARDWRVKVGTVFIVCAIGKV
jgi:hypothetical protein